MFHTCDAVFRILKSSVSDGNTGCIPVEGWSVALGTTILGMTWHYVDKNWNMRSVPIETLKMGTAAETGQQLRAMIEEVLAQNPIEGSDDIFVRTARS